MSWRRRNPTSRHHTFPSALDRPLFSTIPSQIITSRMFSSHTAFCDRPTHQHGSICTYEILALAYIHTYTYTHPRAKIHTLLYICICMWYIQMYEQGETILQFSRVPLSADCKESQYRTYHYYRMLATWLIDTRVFHSYVITCGCTTSTKRN